VPGNAVDAVLRWRVRDCADYLSGSVRDGDLHRRLPSATGSSGSSASSTTAGPAGSFAPASSFGAAAGAFRIGLYLCRQIVGDDGAAGGIGGHVAAGAEAMLVP